MDFNFENKTSVQCENCGCHVVVLHDHEHISFCPVCGEDIDGETEEWLLQHVDED